MTRITLELGDTEVTHALGAALGLFAHLQQTLEIIGNYLITSVKDRFPAGVDRDGVALAPNSPAIRAQEKTSP